MTALRRASTNCISKCTPGPWDYELWQSCEPAAPDIYRVIASRDDSHEATLCELWSGEHDNEANARLISAAPDLLSVCEDTVRKLEYLTGEGIVQMPRTIDLLKAAIAKATGK